jgi:RNA polymerase sigma-70 factor, ECF subfamily
MAGPSVVRTGTSWPEPSDRERRYDQELTKLFEEYWDQVLRYAHPGLSRESAEDITNFAFMAARLHWAVVREYVHPIGYVFKTAYNMHADALAQAAKQPTVSLDDPRTPEPLARTAGPDVEDIWALREALHQLSPREEQFVILYYWTGFSETEIADALGLSSGHVSRTLSDARARLLRLLSPPNEDDQKGRHDG